MKYLACFIAGGLVGLLGAALLAATRDPQDLADELADTLDRLVTAETKLAARSHRNIRP